MVGYQFDGYWEDLGRPDDYERATQDFESMRSQFLPEGPWGRINMSWRIPLSDLDFGSEEKHAVDDVLRTQVAHDGRGHAGFGASFRDLRGRQTRHRGDQRHRRPASGLRRRRIGLRR